MTAIFITGNEDDNGFRVLLEEILSLTYRITYVKGNTLYQWGRGTRF